MNRNYPKILIFCKGALPSDEAMEIAEQYGPNVSFRNANFVSASAPIEKCDGVAGEVPESYKKVPTADEAWESFQTKRQEAVKKAVKKKAVSKSKNANQKKQVDENSKVAQWKPNA